MEMIFDILVHIGLFVVGLVVVKFLVSFFFAVLTLLLSPGILADILSDLRAIRERDPAAEGWIAALFYPGWWALTLHRLYAHPLYKLRLRTLARLINFGTRFLTAVDIHPGAQFGKGIFIDHAQGVVIGETAVVGDNVTILHQVTLGGTGKQTGKRHPTIEEGVLISAGAKVLGNIVIGKNAKIGAGSVVVRPVPPDSTVVGVPGRVVATKGKRTPLQTLDQTTLPDPVVDRLLELQKELRFWEKQVVEKKFGSKRTHKNELPNDILAEIIAHKRIEVEDAKKIKSMEEIAKDVGKRGAKRSFYDALRCQGLSLIAEIKKASPSGGLIRPDFNPSEIARIYQHAGASAISVLTDEKYFQGSLNFLADVRSSTRLPLLRKDFIIDEYQIVEAARAGADAILLIVACLDDAQLKDYREKAEAEGMDALVEVHDEAEMERALKSGVKILGINNRNLKTLETTLDTTYRLLKHVPEKEARNGLLLVSESGIRGPEDTASLANHGVDAVLIGETFMRADDIEHKVHEVMGIWDYSI